MGKLQIWGKSLS